MGVYPYPAPPDPPDRRPARPWGRVPQIAWGGGGPCCPGAELLPVLAAALLVGPLSCLTCCSCWSAAALPGLLLPVLAAALLVALATALPLCLAAALGSLLYRKSWSFTALSAVPIAALGFRASSALPIATRLQRSARPTAPGPLLVGPKQGPSALPGCRSAGLLSGLPAALLLCWPAASLLCHSAGLLLRLAAALPGRCSCLACRSATLLARCSAWPAALLAPIPCRSSVSAVFPLCPSVHDTSLAHPNRTFPANFHSIGRANKISRSQQLTLDNGVYAV